MENKIQKRTITDFLNTEYLEYALKKLVSYLQNDPDKFQLIIDNYFNQSDFESME